MDEPILKGQHFMLGYMANNLPPEYVEPRLQAYQAVQDLDPLVDSYGDGAQARRMVG